MYVVMKHVNITCFQPQLFQSWIYEKNIRVDLQKDKRKPASENDAEMQVEDP